MDPTLWNLTREAGRLHMEGVDLSALAAERGTPLYVGSAATLRARCQELRDAFRGYPAQVDLHFSYKTNRVAGVLRVLHGEGLGAEVVDGYELWLARRLGVDPTAIVFNGPNKSDEELEAAVDAGIGLLVVDGLDELDRLGAVAARRERDVDIALRICPDVVPRGMNASSVTGSRKNQFGLDAEAGEVDEAIARAVRTPRLALRGVHAHIGSGIHDLRAFRRAADRVLRVQAAAAAAGAPVDRVDLGGGLGTRLSREFTSIEMLAYLGLGRLPRLGRPGPADLFAAYGAAVTEAVVDGARTLGLPVPRLLLEPGRAVVSDSQVLLLTVGAVRERPGVGRFALTDGGAMTVSMMFLSERHAVTLANREAPDDGVTSVFGRLPSPMDVVYRNLPSPALRVGDVLAVMDAGAYFNSTATNFGGPRPPVALVDGGAARLARRRETFEDLARRELDLDLEPPDVRG